MTTPVTVVGKDSIVARTPSSVLCSPAPSMRMPMPSSSGQVARIGFTDGGFGDLYGRAGAIIYAGVPRTLLQRYGAQHVAAVHRPSRRAGESGIARGQCANLPDEFGGHRARHAVDIPHGVVLNQIGADQRCLLAHQDAQ